MGVHAIAQVVPFPVKPPTLGAAANALVPAPNFEELDRQARGGITRRAIDDSERAGTRLHRRRGELGEAIERRRGNDSRQPANDRLDRDRAGAGEFGLHIAADPYPERVQHSSPFIAQVIGQTVGHASSATGEIRNEGITAYDGAVARTESYFGAYDPVEFRV